MVPFLRAAMRADEGRAPATSDEIPLASLVPTMHYDAQIVQSSRGTLGSHRMLGTALDALERTIPGVERVDLPGVGHVAADNMGRPRLVARELRRFFGAGPS